MEENNEASPEKILEKLETAIEKMGPKTEESEASTDEDKITILITTISHGEKIILRKEIQVRVVKKF